MPTPNEIVEVAEVAAAADEVDAILEFDADSASDAIVEVFAVSGVECSCDRRRTLAEGFADAIAEPAIAAPEAAMADAGEMVLPAWRTE